jgi:hypothetical protein
VSLPNQVSAVRHASLAPSSGVPGEVQHTAHFLFTAAGRPRLPPRLAALGRPPKRTLRARCLDPRRMRIAAAGLGAPGRQFRLRRPTPAARGTRSAPRPQPLATPPAGSRSSSRLSWAEPIRENQRQSGTGHCGARPCRAPCPSTGAGSAFGTERAMASSAGPPALDSHTRRKDDMRRGWREGGLPSSDAPVDAGHQVRVTHSVYGA